MNALARHSNPGAAAHRLKSGFLRWQCRVRQMAMRENEGRPDAAITPLLVLAGDREAFRKVVTVLPTHPCFSQTSELAHMAKTTHDPARRREHAVRFLSAAYYQNPEEFSDVLSAVFPRASSDAAAIHGAGFCTLKFEAYAQEVVLTCRVETLDQNDPLYIATWRHNHLFNPNLERGAVILAFRPDWSASAADPAF